MNTVKGEIKNSRFENKYDLDGIPYKDYIFYINSQQFIARIKENIYLSDGMSVVLDIKPGSLNEVIAGYCIKEGYTWGEHANTLKSEVSQFEKYNFLEGIIIEKRRSTTGSIYMNRSALSNRGTKISYTIILDTGEMHVSADEGEYLQVGMDIAAVLDKTTSIIILDKGADKYLGLSKPWFIVFFFAIVLFNGYMFYAENNPVVNFKVTLIVINIFLALSLLLSIATFRVTNSAKKFLLPRISK